MMDEKVNGAASAGTETTPMNSDPTTSSEIADTLAQIPVLVKGRTRSEELRHLHFSCNVPARELVSTVQTIFPKFDKTVLSKAENADKYGVEIGREAMKLLWETYAPEEYEKRKRHMDGHKLTKRLYCRLDDEAYEEFITRSREDGFKDSNECLTALIREYLSKNHEKENREC